jgi:hypothetical protein
MKYFLQKINLRIKFYSLIKFIEINMNSPKQSNSFYSLLKDKNSASILSDIEKY